MTHNHPMWTKGVLAIAAALVVSILASSTFRAQEAHARAQAADFGARDQPPPSRALSASRILSASPGLHCRIVRIGLEGMNRIGVRADCRRDGKTVPFAASWSVRYADMADARCRIGTPAGRGRSFNLPSNPVAYKQYSGPMLPAIVRATFTVVAEVGNQVATATRTWTKRTPDSRLLCGDPPRLRASPGPSPPVCTLDGAPSVKGLVTRVRGVRCVGGSGRCTWSSAPPITAAGGYVNWFRIINCWDGAKKYQASLGFDLYVSRRGGVIDCQTGFGFSSGTLNALPTWGPGSISVKVDVANLDIPEQFPPGSVAQGPWRPLRGTVDPCVGIGAEHVFPPFSEASRLAGSLLQIDFGGQVAASSNCAPRDRMTPARDSLIYYSGRLLGGWAFETASQDPNRIGGLNVFSDWSGTSFLGAYGVLPLVAPGGQKFKLWFDVDREAGSCPPPPIPRNSALGPAYPFSGILGVDFNPSGRPLKPHAYVCGFLTVSSRTAATTQPVSLRLVVARATPFSARTRWVDAAELCAAGG